MTAYKPASPPAPLRKRLRNLISRNKRADITWQILPIGSGEAGALWYWEQRSDSGKLLARSAGFTNHQPCLDDAIAHGYLADALT